MKGKRYDQKRFRRENGRICYSDKQGNVAYLVTKPNFKGILCAFKDNLSNAIYKILLRTVKRNQRYIDLACLECRVSILRTF